MPRFKHITGLGNVQFTPEEEKKADEQVIAHEKAQEEYLKIKYKDDRLKEYPSLQECIHAILDDDLEALQAKRKLVKEKYPKP
tara:strand:- start:197 stop:445 length:249 start_codon:yes stop_codon:yes gene_type:complete